jgi:hypothetical protein
MARAAAMTVRLGEFPDESRFCLRIIVRVLSLLLVGVAALAMDRPADAVEVMPHKAIYVLHSRHIPGAEENVSADGMLVFEWLDTCDGWSVNQRAKLRLGGGDDEEEAGFEWRQITWESKDGRRYRYQSEEFRNGERGDQRRGEARLEASGKGAVTTALPTRSQHDLPAGVMLPTAHSLRLLQAAAAGESFLSADVFDGTVSDEPITITAAFGPGTLHWHDQDKQFPALAKIPSRPVDLAFFLDPTPEGMPDFEQSLQLYDNGVIGKMVFSFAGIPMEGELRQLEVSPKDKCKSAPTP